MTINDKIRDEEIAISINKEAPKIPVLSLSKFDSINILTAKKYCHLIKGE